jgi:hypothetical protein
MALKRGVTVVGTLIVAVAIGVAAWTFAQRQDERLPEPKQPRTLCAFPKMDFDDLTIGLPYAEVKRRYANHPAELHELEEGCVAYRYDAYLFAAEEPPAFITLQFGGGRVMGKWLQNSRSDRPECAVIKAVVDVGDTFGPR